MVGELEPCGGCWLPLKFGGMEPRHRWSEGRIDVAPQDILGVLPKADKGTVSVNGSVGISSDGPSGQLGFNYTIPSVAIREYSDTRASTRNDAAWTIVPTDSRPRLDLKTASSCWFETPHDSDDAWEMGIIENKTLAVEQLGPSHTANPRLRFSRKYR